MTDTTSVSPSPAPDDRRMAILQRLAAIEAEPWNGAGVRILYAGESGSRAWGFASRDSDWEVRLDALLWDAVMGSATDAPGRRFAPAATPGA